MKVLIVNECSELNTGYGIMGKNIIKALIESGIEVTELALFIDPEDPKLKNIKWPYIVNSPSSSEEKERFNSNRFNVEGMWSFDRALLEVRPDVCINIRDPYAYQYESISAFRDYFNWVIFAPVDGIDQPNQWIETFRNCEGLFTISEWGKEALESYNVKVNGTIYPSYDGFYELPKEQIDNIKKSMGIDKCKIIGTVMRNQPRKLFPSLFEGFRKYIDKTGDNTLLYCHTRHPDGGWDIPTLLTKYNLTSKVLFTYHCNNCKKSHNSIYKDLLVQCPFCKTFSSKLGCIFDGISTETMNIVYNMFDVYFHLACREGFGIPQLEAAATNRTIVTVNYAGMKDVGNKVNAYMIEPNSLTHTHGMQMFEAAINSDTVAEYMEIAINNPKPSRETALKNFGNWKENVQCLVDHIKNLKPRKSWDSKADIKPVESFKKLNLSNSDYIKYLFIRVLQKPEWLGNYAYTRMIRDLNYGATYGGTHGLYFIESSNVSSTIPFSREDAYNICANYRNYLNLWEKRRVEYE